ncbi:hypothetical protein HK097_009168, partial [Rhizophlyctis rosea]
GSLEAIDNSEGGNKFTRVFRWFNLLRAVAAGTYGIYQAAKSMGDPVYEGVGARGLMIASIFFIVLEIVVAFVKAFPRMFWICWNSEGWDPYAKFWTVWAIVADHELITDVVPALVSSSSGDEIALPLSKEADINVILKVYSYRLTELLAEPNAKNTLTQTNFTFSFANLTSDKYHNFVLLLLFAASLAYTILFHSLRLGRILAFKKGATVLGLVVVIKGLCLLLDAFTNGVLLYEVLVFKGKDFLRTDDWMSRIMLSVVCVGGVVGLGVNALVNLPLHYKFLQLQLSTLSTTSSSKPPRSAILPTALRKTFHPYLLPIFIYALYCIIGILLILGRLRDFNPLGDIAAGRIPAEMVPTGGFFGWNGGGDKRDVMIGLVWLDLVVNYGVGVLTTGVYWGWRGVGGCLGKK